MREDLGAHVLLPGGGGEGEQGRGEGTTEHEHCTSHKSSSLGVRNTRGAARRFEQAGRAEAGGRLTDEGGRGVERAPALPAPRGLACVGLRSADLARDAALLAPIHDPATS